ncbi:MAG: hypothetical protein LQ346_002927 [Caloplaca aetnensis]|nr:MAG: hypothetical protein LQ346_002927 [Caloplaca aetnensis]
MAQYGGYSNNTGGHASNPYDQGSNRYNQDAGNPYAQQAENPYGAAQSGGYGARPQQGGYVGGNDVEMTTMNGGGAGRDPNAILNECREIDRGIDSIERNLERLRFLQQRAIDDTDASSNTATNRELDALSSETMTLYRSFGHRLKTIKGMKESGDPRNSPQVGRVDRKLKTAINEYQQVDRDFRQKLSAQMERQYRIVRPEASDAEVREAIEDTSSSQVFSQALLQSNRRGQSQSALRAVQGRHEAIQKIESQMIELAQLFQDVDAAIVEQEAPVQQIEKQTEHTQENVAGGNKHLDGAIVKARSIRKKKWICLGLGSKLSIYRYNQSDLEPSDPDEQFFSF